MLIKRSPQQPPVEIPSSEIHFHMSRGGGPGGQNVNKVETKVTAIWDFRGSRILNDAQKAILAEKLKNRINALGQISVQSQETRSQETNRIRAGVKLNQIATDALMVAPQRTRTRVPRREKEKRLESKRHQSEKKESRKRISSA